MNLSFLQRIAGIATVAFMLQLAPIMAGRFASGGAPKPGAYPVGMVNGWVVFRIPQLVTSSMPARVLLTLLLCGLLGASQAPLLAATNDASAPDAISSSRPELGELPRLALEGNSAEKVEVREVTRGYLVRPDQVQKGLLE